MKELKELVDRYDVSCHCGAVDVKPKQDGHLVMYSDYIALEQRAESAEAALAEEKRINSKLREDRAGLARECNAFEAKLAELEKQEPVAQVTTWWPLGIDAGEQKMLQPLGNLPGAGTKLFARPAPAINLAELVPDEKSESQFEMHRWAEKAMDIREVKGWNDCRAAMLRYIEDQSK